MENVPHFPPSAAGAHGLCTQHLEELWRTPPFFVPSAARSCFKWVILWWLSVLYMTHLVFLQLWQSGRWAWEDFTALFPSCLRWWGRGQLFEFLIFPIWRHLCPRDICKLNMLRYQPLSFCLGLLTLLSPPPSSFDWILDFALLFFPLDDCKHVSVFQSKNFGNVHPS